MNEEKENTFLADDNVSFSFSFIFSSFSFCFSVH